MKRLKWMMLGAVLSAILSVTAFATQEQVKVYVNGMRLNETAIIQEDRTFIPLRAVSEAMGAQVDWDGQTRSAFVSFTEDDTIAQLVSDISPSVVTIIGNYAGDGEVYKHINPTAHGSGVIYKSNGYIITNAHVVEDIINLTVVLNDGTSLPAKVMCSDKDADLAIVKIEKLGLLPVKMADSATIMAGKTAIAVGTPISLSMRNSVTKGIVSGVDVALSGSYYKLTQTDASINPGNSGGPLINAKGELIGISSSKFASAGIDNMGFAIPVDTVTYFINQYEVNGKIVRPSINISFEESWEAKIGLPTTKGITIKSSSNSALKAGDTVISVNGIAVHSVADWNEALKDTYNGTGFKVSYIRGGVISETDVTA